MGLDMYLHRNTYNRTKNYNHVDGTSTREITGILPGTTIDLNRVSTITEEVIYWRKANHIHKWFVDNVQSGEDDCGHYSVGVEQLTTLRDLCRSVLDNPKLAPKLLPTQQGFFFGGNEYDEWYIKDTQHTADQITALLLQGFDEGVSQWYEYHSSW